ncbi:uncharacterized protein TRUGW13939_10913 [Talaromyces rugulosus]|uniref:Uncharacterized protein n=1 Tax=Talaromyces rugulosus TaxID=121627 RepID=A0A7H8RBE0_TALRU|nr:uncharacterized protein TRUGW13939_10913 [Talaromyces rugulosus]QKX63742.1 hypothetical protein TRUGW13939_10913 [Talaromyces rugulosus]
MAEKSELIPVNDIVDDDERLIEKVREKVSMDVVLDKNWSIGGNLEEVDASIPALLIKKNGEWGAVRVDTSPVLNEVTGPTIASGFSLLVIKPGETCRFYREPSNSSSSDGEICGMGRPSWVTFWARSRASSVGLRDDRMVFIRSNMTLLINVQASDHWLQQLARAAKCPPILSLSVSAVA